MPPRIRLSLRLEPDDHAKMQRFAASNGVTIQALLEAGIHLVAGRVATHGAEPVETWPPGEERLVEMVRYARELDQSRRRRR